MDPSVQVALIGIITTAIATSGVTFVAILNNRKERGQSAESAVERTLRERITLRDEQIAELREDLKQREQDVAAREEAIRARDKIIVQLREEIELRKEGRL